MEKPPLYLVDASIYIFRSWFSMPDSIVDDRGESINALYGYLLFVAKFLKQSQARYIAFAFDESLQSCFRNKIYPDYKSSRGLPDENLAYQLKLCKKFTDLLGLACFSSKRYEADDLIGSLAQQYRKKVHACIILTRDKDLGQLLLGGNDVLWDFSEQTTLNSQEFKLKFGVKPEQFVDYLALVGDAVDDIPGAVGLGPKSAQFLINRYSNIDNIYASIDEVANLNIRGASRIKNVLIEEKAMVYISHALASIHCDLKPSKTFLDLRWQGVNLKKLDSALSRYHIQGRTRTAILNAFSDKVLLQ